MDILKSIGIDKDKLSFPYLLKENRNLYRDINKLIKENEKLSDSEYRWMETSGYMEHLYNESKIENELLKDENARLNDMCFQLTQENSLMDKRIDEMEKDSEEDYYHTKELDYGLLSKTIDKITDERNTYKEVINIMCDKFDISHDSVLNIIDDISQNKSVEKERV